MRWFVWWALLAHLSIVWTRLLTAGKALPAFYKEKAESNLVKS
jgi:hypothetical protein